MTERCGWCGTDPLYVDYHDREWGVPERDGRALWELLMLEGQQAGLAWITILRKRETMRAAYAGFRPEIIAGWGEDEVTRLLSDPGIIRHRGKIGAAISNAAAFLRLGGAEAFSAFVWGHVDNTPIQGARQALTDVPARTPESERLSKSLTRAGFRFCGPTTVYAFMQAAGLVNDHLVTCPAHGGAFHDNAPAG